MKLSAAFLGALIAAATDAGAAKASVEIFSHEPRIQLQCWFGGTVPSQQHVMVLPIAFAGGMGPAQYPPQMIRNHVTAKLTMMLLDAGKDVGIAKGLM